MGSPATTSESLGQRPPQAVIQTKQERRESDALQGCHWTVALLKRWLLGTHAGTSLTSGTLLEKTRKPFKVWFRAVFEISARRNGISAKELQRILGLGDGVELAAQA